MRLPHFLWEHPAEPPKFHSSFQIIEWPSINLMLSLAKIEDSSMLEEPRVTVTVMKRMMVNRVIAISKPSKRRLHSQKKNKTSNSLSGYRTIMLFSS